MDKWFVFSNNTVVGPYTQQQVMSLISDGSVTLQDKICKADEQEWRVVTEFSEFASLRKESKGIFNRIFSGNDNSGNAPAAVNQQINGEDVRLNCPHCDQHYSVKYSMLNNQIITCRNCERLFTLTLDPAAVDVSNPTVSLSYNDIPPQSPDYSGYSMSEGVDFSEDIPEGNITCPHCWKTFSPENVCYISCHPDLIGDEIAGEFEQKRFLPTVYHSNGLPLDERGMPCTDMACPHCHLRIPGSIIDLASGYYSVAGAPSAGKSYFLTSMVHDLRKTLPLHSYSFYDVDPVINRVINGYEDAIFMAADSSQVVSLPKTQQIGSDFSNQIIKNGVAFELPKPFIFRFQSSNFVPKKKRIDQNLVFYDNAGEHFQPGADSIANPATIHLAHSNGIIFLFDPLNDANMRKDCDRDDPQTMLNTKITDQTTLFAEMVNRIRRHGNMSSGETSDIPLVIAIGKYDAWKNLLPKDIENISVCCENENDFSLAIDMNTVLDVSFALREMMMQAAPGLVSQAETFFKKVYFVPVSSFGCLASQAESGNIGIIPAQLKPVWVSVPLTLLLSENGFIEQLYFSRSDSCEAGFSSKVMDGKILFHHPVTKKRVILPGMYAGAVLEIAGKYYRLPDANRVNASENTSASTGSVWS